MKKLSTFAIAAVMAFSLIFVPRFGGVCRTEASDLNPNDISVPFRNLNADEIVAEMGAGWNLGNTFDGHNNFTPSEYAWQEYKIKTCQKLIDSVHDLGFNTVRIPITWGTMIDDSNGYNINSEWIGRIRDVVDYAVKRDMYAVINIHHDGAERSGWLDISKSGEDWLKVKEKFGAVWKQIAEYFKDYDEHLLFEDMNEVWGSNSDYPHDFQQIMELNQIFTDTVRTSGSNNISRWLIVTGRYTNIDEIIKASNKFTLPTDSLNETDKFMVSVHDYVGDFGMSVTGRTDYTVADAKNYASKINQLVSAFTSKGIPVFFGEYGAINKNNSDFRGRYYETIARYCKVAGIVPVIWDNGGVGIGSDNFAIITRDTHLPVVRQVLQGTMRGYFYNTDVKVNEVSSTLSARADAKTPVTSIASITPEKSVVSLEAGSAYTAKVTYLPENSNDVILWTTSESDVATVYNGMIRAKKSGSAVITAYAQSGYFSNNVIKTEITVNVYPANLKKNITSLSAVKTEYQIADGESVYMDLSLTGSVSYDYITFESSDEQIATVNEFGKITAACIHNGTVPAVPCGNAVITATTASGLTASVTVKVGNPSYGNGILSAKTNTVTLTETENSKEITVLSSGECGKITFTSSNPKIAAVSGKAEVPTDGNLSVKITALGKGTTEITAVAENGSHTTFTVTSEAENKTGEGVSYILNKSEDPESESTDTSESASESANTSAGESLSNKGESNSSGSGCKSGIYGYDMLFILAGTALCLIILTEKKNEIQ